MNISFESNDPFNSPVVDAVTGKLLLEVTTRHKFGRRTTTVCNAQKRVVAKYEHRWGFGKDRVTYHDHTKRLSDWLPKKGGRSSSRMFAAPNGRAYVWKQRAGSRSFNLVDCQSHVPVAATHRATQGFFTATENMGIQVVREVMPFLDAVVLSFIICEDERRNRSSATAGAAAGVSAGGGGGGC
ncbi:hypothetical protein C8Q76DRAFT_165140 [Earliella scabrosa]|nr:hypothetical protein C8Q76DRAFT_165140 [Earliella scabrosa]